MPFLETCIANLEPMDRTRLRDASFDVVVKPCLQRCGTCRDRSVLVVDGEARTGESHGSLLASLIRERESEGECESGGESVSESASEGDRESESESERESTCESEREPEREVRREYER